MPLVGRVDDKMNCITETDLVNTFAKSFTDFLPRNRHYRTLCEVETTWGVVDTLIVSSRRKALQQRRSLTLICIKFRTKAYTVRGTAACDARRSAADNEVSVFTGNPMTLQGFVNIEDGTTC
jgi:hypothetical protein